MTTNEKYSKLEKMALNNNDTIIRIGFEEDEIKFRVVVYAVNYFGASVVKTARFNTLAEIKEEFCKKPR